MAKVDKPQEEILQTENASIENNEAPKSEQAQDNASDNNIKPSGFKAKLKDLGSRALDGTEKDLITILLKLYLQMAKDTQQAKKIVKEIEKNKIKGEDVAKFVDGVKDKPEVLEQFVASASELSNSAPKPQELAEQADDQAKELDELQEKLSDMQLSDKDPQLEEQQANQYEQEHGIRPQPGDGQVKKDDELEKEQYGQNNRIIDDGSSNAISAGGPSPAA